MKFKPIILCMLILVSLAPLRTSALPQVDGIVTDGEWEDAEFHVIELNTGIEVNLSIIYTTEKVYYMAAIDHSGEVNEINLDPSEPHDYFGLEFDNNKDAAIMGTEDSPDDTIIVNYKENTAADMFMHSYKAFYDTDYGGVDNTEGRAGTDGENLFFEFSKPRISDDRLGNDFNLIQGAEYKIMIAFWDDQPPHSALAGFNKRVDNEQFLSLIVDDVRSTIAYEIAAIMVFALSGIFAYVMIEKGSFSNPIRGLFRSNEA